MRYLKLFEEIKIIEEKDFPFLGYDLSVRERNILHDLVGGGFFNAFIFKVDDHYYYAKYYDIVSNYNRFEDFSELRDYVLSFYYMSKDKPEKYLDLLNTSKLDPSFDRNWPIRWASINGHKEIVKLLLNDERVRSKLSEEEINKYSR